MFYMILLLVAIFAIKLYILCNDYDKAVEIINDVQIKDLSGITIHPKAEVWEE